MSHCLKSIGVPFALVVGLVSSLSPAGMGAERSGMTVDEPLSSVGYRPSDVGLTPDSFQQPYTCSWVRRTLMDPLRDPVFFQEWAEGVLESSPCSLGFMGLLGTPADIVLSTASARAEPVPIRDLENSGFSVEVRRALERLVGEAVAIQEVFGRIETKKFDREWIELEGLLMEDQADLSVDLETDPLESSVRKRIRLIGGLRDIPREPMWEGAQRLIVCVRDLLQALERDETKVTKDFSCETPAGRIVIGGMADQVHDLTGDEVLVLDIGGDDVYRGSVASGRNGRCAVVLDMAGDDLYSSTAPFSLAVGRRGIGCLIDRRGDDVYRSGIGSQGCGVFGAGLLIDSSGRDIYSADRLSQGCGVWGFGALRDGTGDDSYQLDQMGQGYAGVGGIGVLADDEGNDRYLAGQTRADPREPGVFQSLSQGFSIGLRDYAAGGVGALLDGAGHDFYKIDYFGQGAAYWYSLGLLYDREGRDSYFSRRYAQGAGVHSAAGYLLEARGDDVYWTWGGSQGMGWDYGAGSLMDQAGDDIYTAEWGSQGAGATNGWGFFTDNQGADLYYSQIPHGEGFGCWDDRRHASSLGLFVDADGDDRYPAAGRRRLLWNNDRWGVGVDLSSGPLTGWTLRTDLPFRGDTPSLKQQEEERSRLQKRFSRSRQIKDPAVRWAEVLDVAGSWGLDEETPRDARQWLLNQNPDALFPTVVESLDCRQTMGYLFQEELYLRYGEAGIRTLMRRIAQDEPGESGDETTRRRAWGVYYLGQTAAARSVDAVLPLLSDASWKIRALASQALGTVYDRSLSEHREKIGKYLREGAAGKKGLADYVKGVPYEDRLRLVFDRQPIPWGVFRRLRKDSPRKEEAFHQDWTDYLIRTKSLLIADWDSRRAAGVPEPVIERLGGLLGDPDPRVRHAAAIALGKIGATGLSDRLVPLMSDEKILVRNAAAWALKGPGMITEDRLKEVVRSTSPWTRGVALDVLCAVSTGPLSGFLEGFSTDPDWTVRVKVVDLLWSVRDRVDAEPSGETAASGRAARILRSWKDREGHPWVRSKIDQYLSLTPEEEP
ncbi:MAG TPA: HEAT repeat domain-containing protein [Elusimicrobiota bacterium]|nr:HEAT repeat domain-containing protein [Elusimicrobiota bacterium]